MKYIRNVPILLVQDGQITTEDFKACMDLAFRNTGTTDCFIQSDGGIQERIQPGDPLLTWGGYPGYYRNDVINVTFTGGNGRLEVDMTIHTNYKEC